MEIVGPLPIPQYEACVAQKAVLGVERAAVSARLADFGIYPESAPSGTSSGTDLTSIANQIGTEVAAIPQGSGVSQTQTLAERVSALNLSQAEAAQVTDAASKTAFGATAGIITLPDGTKIVMPADYTMRVAMQVSVDGTVTVYKGDLGPFWKYLPR